MTKQEQQNNNNAKTTAIIVGVLIFLWIVLGLVAFIWSLVCFGRSGTTAQHVIGLLLALFLGPFYFIYFFVAPNYCKVL